MKTLRTMVTVTALTCFTALFTGCKKDCHRPHPPKPKHECNHPQDESPTTTTIDNEESET